MITRHVLFCRREGFETLGSRNPPSLESWMTQWKGDPKKLTLMSKPLSSPVQRLVDVIRPPPPPPLPPPGMNEFEVSLDEVTMACHYVAPPLNEAPSTNLKTITQDKHPPSQSVSALRFSLWGI